MNCCRFTLLLASVAFSYSTLLGQANLSDINKQLKSLTAVPPPMPGGPPKAPGAEGQRPTKIVQVAKDIRSLPAGEQKVKAADTLAHALMEGESNDEAVQATADALAQALSETPQQPEKDGRPAEPYIDLARLVIVGSAKTTLNDPMLAKAKDILLSDQADEAKADFTLKDLNGKKVTLSGLKGKIVLINFWAINCGACRQEMQDLDLIYTHYQQQGLAILSITGDNPFTVATYLRSKDYHPTVLFDDGGKVGKEFHVDELHEEGLPRTFVFDRNGKLIAESVGACTQRQFFGMLGAAGLKPN